MTTGGQETDSHSRLNVLPPYFCNKSVDSEVAAKPCNIKQSPT